MRSKILPAILLLLFLAPSAFALQNANKKPTPKPKPSASNPTKPTPKPTASVPPKLGQTSAALTREVVPFTDLVFTWPGFMFLFVAGVVAFGLGAGIGAWKLSDNQAQASLRGLEALLLAVIGGLIARVFIAFLLTTASDSDAAHIAVGWGFFIVPGGVDTIAWLIDGEVVTSAEFLVWMGTVVGAITGFFNGFWKIHNWKGLGWLAFPLDVTWGLAGATLGSLLHLINFAWAEHADQTDHVDELRAEVHRYKSGFRFKGDFAQTQGPVMSNLDGKPGSDSYRHERLHVWQNRIFGPLFSLSYLGWMAIWLIPAAIAAIVTRDIQAIEAWCYFNNPWELWGFHVGNQSRTEGDRPKLVWGDLVVLILSIIYFAGVISLTIWIVTQVWEFD